MAAARFVFYPDLPFFLARDSTLATTFSPRVPAQRDLHFETGQTIKHLVESLGVPHTEIGIVRVNGREANLNQPARDQDSIEIFAAAGCPPSAGEEDFRIRFILDNHLGRLAAELRMMGFDSLYRNDYQDEELARISAEQDRILLTRDRRLLMRRVVRCGYCPRSLDSQQQLVEVVQRFDLCQHITPFKRCLRCNGPLRQVNKEEVLDRLEPLTRQYYHEFHICETCGQIYWKGSHHERMLQRLSSVCPDIFNPG